MARAWDAGGAEARGGGEGGRAGHVADGVLRPVDEVAANPRGPAPHRERPVVVAAAQRQAQRRAPTARFRPMNDAPARMVFVE